MATNKQKALAKKILQNPTMEMGAAMKEVGFSENTRPHDVANTQGWQELLKKYLPDDEVLKAHKAGLKATKIVTSHTEPDKVVDDHQIRLKAVELAYRVKGRANQPNLAVQVNNYVPILGGKSKDV